MSYIDEMLEFNKHFVENQEYRQFITTKFPDKKIAILSCMDTRLAELLPAALNFKNGDIKIIKNAGGVITHPFGSVMRSLIVAIYEMGVEEILIIGHYDCGMQCSNPEKIIDKMINRGVKQSDIDFIKYCKIDVNNWLTGFEDPVESIKETINIIVNHPLVPKDIKVYGYVIDPTTGRLDPVER